MASVRNKEEVAAALHVMDDWNHNLSWFAYLGGIKTTPNPTDLSNEIWTWADGSGTFTSQEYKDNNLFRYDEPNNGPEGIYLTMYTTPWAKGELIDIPPAFGTFRPAFYTCCNENIDIALEEPFQVKEKDINKEGEHLYDCAVSPPEETI